MSGYDNKRRPTNRNQNQIKRANAASTFSKWQLQTVDHTMERCKQLVRVRSVKILKYYFETFPLALNNRFKLSTMSTAKFETGLN